MDAKDKFFKAYYASMKDYFLEFEATAHGLTAANYWQKVLSPTKIQEHEFEEIEQKLGFSLPDTFKDFYKRCYALDADFDTGGLYLAGYSASNKLASLEKYLFNDGIAPEILKLKLIPFGLYQDEWYVCLDINQDQTNPPVVLFEMSNWGNGKEAISHSNWFSNFDKLLECIAAYQEQGNWEEFDQIDPANNYTTAYDYWKK